MDASPGAEIEERSALPRRMIVEWVYCPRLFHYMHVEGLMVANEHVFRGRHAHARTDTPGTSRARRAVTMETPPEDEGDHVPVEWREARAIDLGATDLGVVAKLDSVILDGEGRAIPAELKSGGGPAEGSTYPTLTAGAWDADAIQVAVQAMALERAGYAVPHGELYYRASRTRVRVLLTDALRNEALRVIALATAAQRATERPAPLVDSPKCRGCSLVEVCLPDESNLLREGVAADDGLDDLDDDAQVTAPAGKLSRGRRLVATSMDTRTITVSTAGASIRKEGEALVLVPPPDAGGMPQGKPVRVPMDSVDALVLLGCFWKSGSSR